MGRVEWCRRSTTTRLASPAGSRSFASSRSRWHSSQCAARHSSAAWARSAAASARSSSVGASGGGANGGACPTGGGGWTRDTRRWRREWRRLRPRAPLAHLRRSFWMRANHACATRVVDALVAGDLRERLAERDAREPRRRCASGSRAPRRRSLRRSRSSIGGGGRPRGRPGQTWWSLALVHAPATLTSGRNILAWLRTRPQRYCFASASLSRKVSQAKAFARYASWIRSEQVVFGHAPLEQRYPHRP